MTGTTQIMRRFEWDAAHRIMGHEGKGKYLHGHCYVAEVVVTAANLDTVGRVIDFGKVKEEVGGWINQWWDHNVLLHQEDFLGVFLENHPEEREPYLMKFGNPTAENIARELWEIASGLLQEFGISVVHVRVWETLNCWADYRPQ